MCNETKKRPHQNLKNLNMNNYLENYSKIKQIKKTKQTDQGTVKLVVDQYSIFKIKECFKCSSSHPY